MKHLFLTIFIFLSLLIKAQSASEAESLFNNKQYAKAKTAYELLLKKKPNDALYNYRYARCNYELKNNEIAIKHFELAGTRYPLKDLYLGELYFSTYQFELSVSAYQTYLSTLEPDDKKSTEINQLIKKSEIGSKLINRIENITIFDSIVVSKSDFLRFYNLSNDLGKLAQQRIRMNNKSTQDLISFITQRGDRQFFSDTTKNQMDIFSNYKLLDEWSPATALSATVNTKANENYPFLLLDGISLYYASDGENSIGGYDIFLTKYSSSTKDYLTPENVGFPFNSTANDYMMVIDELHKVGWFATDRFQSTGKVTIYKFEYNDPKVYFKSDDSVLLRNVAQLKTYKLSEKKQATTTSSTKSDETISPNYEFIVITDSIVYNNAEEFQLSKALQLYNESMQMNADLQNLSATISDLREKYSNPDTKTEKQNFAEQIRKLETEELKLKKGIIAKKKEAVNNEIQFLFGK